MRRFASLALLALAGCSSSDDGAAPAADAGAEAAAPLDPTFTNVMKVVITGSNCGGPLCHTPVPGATVTAGGFKLGNATETYGQLINQPATGPKCGPETPDGGGADGGAAADSGAAAGPVRLRVVPGSPDDSLLYTKLAGTAGCGDQMPVGREPNPDHIQLVHDWIAAGANKD